MSKQRASKVAQARGKLGFASLSNGNNRFSQADVHDRFN
ncbi:hypothetical protein GMES_2275 [Paraglaciecola mesophila KMM 241]|uniref:Uncharacterized protein n=1 Tax=Paraglaciecola mesophila KMM 241 TaxID=1128912 RepID=K6YKN8_9ALTE|nr:hypothetical protein GMES_2275 [Paraglaciecola mesophila KMM 241]